MNILNHISSCINTNTPIIVCKFGDGEYACCNRHYGHNCDNDN